MLNDATQVLGIDPGLSGAIALWDSSVSALQVWDMPVLKVRGKSVLNELELANLLLRLSQVDHAYVEQVHAMPGQGVTSMFSFGLSFGVIKGILAAHHMPTTYVTPRSWQTHMQVPKGGKDASRLRALQLLPRYASLFQRVRDNGRSDAALIALFGACQRPG